MDKNTNGLTYEILEGMAKEHYDSIYAMPRISEEDGASLLKEIDYLKVVLNNRIIERNILIDKLKKVTRYFVLTFIALPLTLTGDLVIIIAFLISLITMLKTMREFEPLSNELAHKYDEERVTIERILNNCERMVNKKMVNKEAKEEDVDDTYFLEVYANYVIENYLKTGEIMEYLNPEFDFQVKATLLTMLEDKYGIDISKGIKKSLDTFKEMEENGPKLTRNR